MSKREEEERLTKIEVQEKQQLKTAEIASIAVAAKLNNAPSDKNSNPLYYPSLDDVRDTAKA